MARKNCENDTKAQSVTQPRYKIRLITIKTGKGYSFVALAFDAIALRMNQPLSSGQWRYCSDGQQSNYQASFIITHFRASIGGYCLFNTSWDI